jgi:hypothetical protein
MDVVAADFRRDVHARASGDFVGTDVHPSLNEHPPNSLASATVTCLARPCLTTPCVGQVPSYFHPLQVAHVSTRPPRQSIRDVEVESAEVCGGACKAAQAALDFIILIDGRILTGAAPTYPPFG